VYCVFIMWTQQEAFTFSQDFFCQTVKPLYQSNLFKAWVVQACVKIKCWNFLVFFRVCHNVVESVFHFYNLYVIFFSLIHKNIWENNTLRGLRNFKTSVWNTEFGCAVQDCVCVKCSLESHQNYSVFFVDSEVNQV